MKHDDTTAALAAIAADADHRVAEAALRDAGWSTIGAGDWAFARSRQRMGGAHQPLRPRAADARASAPS